MPGLHSNRIPVTVLGATGVVGQRFVRHIADHPDFELRYVAASERSVGKTYAEACDWHLPGEPYAGFGNLRVVACDPSASLAPLVFSALDAGPAREIEPLYAAAGSMVFSNASTFRMDEDVPLLVPELNAAHLGLLAIQRRKRGWKGGIVTNPNCTTVPVAGTLAPLHRAFGAEAAMVVSMQALSGAGYPGVASLDAVANVIPLIMGEEEKVESESCKILGTFDGERIVRAPIAISAQCNRVQVVDGHMVALNYRLKGSPDPSAVIRAFEDFVPDTEGLNLHTAPNDSPRPQHRAGRRRGRCAQRGARPREGLAVSESVAMQFGATSVTDALQFHGKILEWHRDVAYEPIGGAPPHAAHPRGLIRKEIA